MTTSVGNLSIPYEADDFGYGWVGENETRNQDDAGKFDEVELENVEAWCQVPVTNKMQRNSGFDIIDWITQGAADKLTRVEGSGFVTGTGGKQPKGFMSYAAGTAFNQVEQLTAAASTTIGYDDFIDMETLLRAFYRSGAKYYMNRFIQGYTRKIKDGDSRPYFPQGTEINGYSVGVLDDMAGASSTTLTADDLVIALGDLQKAYIILDHTASMSVIIDPLTNRTSGKTIFQFSKVTGGGVYNFDALKIMKVKT